MKRKFTFAILSLLLALTLSSVAWALLTRTQTITYTLAPTSSVTLVPVGLGTIMGGTGSSLTSPGVLTLSSTAGGTHTITATLSANSTRFSKFDVSFIASNGSDVCDLALGTTTCSWTVSLATSQTYSETTVWTANDGISATGSTLVSVSMT
jgi:hypothetical protein